MSTWYYDAHRFACQLSATSRYTVPQVAGVLAVLSPRLRWELNVGHTLSLVRTGRLLQGRPAPFGRNVEKAQAILAGTPVTKVLRGDKVRAFFDNILRPESSKRVTVDIWALRVYLRREPTGEEVRWLGTRDGYLTVEAWYRNQAARAGMKGHEWQAAQWADKRGYEDVWQPPLPFEAVDS